MTAVRNFLRCGDLASGFLRFHGPDCGHERLLAFTRRRIHLTTWIDPKCSKP